MTNAELIKGLRWCADESICCDDFSGEKCPYYDEKKDSCSVDEILHAAADALEAADEKIADCVAAVEALDDSNDAYIKENERLEKKIAEMEKSYEWKAYAALEESVEGYKTRITELEAQLPKEGEWIEANTRPRSAQFYCSVCHRTCYDIQPTRDKAWTKRCRYQFCPNCGAMMRGEHDEQWTETVSVR